MCAVIYISENLYFTNFINIPCATRKRSANWGMAEAKTINPHLVSQFVQGYLARTKIAAAEVPDLIATIHHSLADLGKRQEGPPAEPAVAIRRSYGRDFVVCLDCGWRGQMLRSHLTTMHGLSPLDYRTRWKLKSAHLLTAPAYSERRSAMAKQADLGRHQVTATETIPEGGPTPLLS
jgi:predicted transcriptional regulator